MFDGAGLKIINFGRGDSGDLIIDVQDKVVLNSDAATYSLTNNSNGGNIRINAKSFSMADNSRIEVYSFGQGTSGDVIINSKDKVVINPNATIWSSSEKNGSGGNILVSTNFFSANSDGTPKGFIIVDSSALAYLAC